MLCYHWTLKGILKKHNPPSSGRREEQLQQNFGSWQADRGVKWLSRPKKSGESQIWASPCCRIPKRLGNWRHQLPLGVGVKHAAKIKRLAECFSMLHTQRPVTAPPSAQQNIHIHPHPTKMSGRASDVLNADPLSGWSFSIKAIYFHLVVMAL